MNRKISIYIAFIVGSASMSVWAQSPSADANIVQTIMDENANILIIQSDALTERLSQGAVIRSSWNHERTEKKANPAIRYRIQVYSDNNRNTAKANAERRKNQVEQAFPDMRGYVSYESPYWRVRMGNFQTEAEAQGALKQIRSRFPSFESDIRIVKVRVK